MAPAARAIVGALALAAASCGSPPSLEPRPASRAFDDTAATRLGRAIAPRAAANPGRSGIHALADAREAFAARFLLARAAERSLDVQYYIWHADLSGMLLFEALQEAAGRGVRVRLLLDDNNTAGMDATLAALDAHPNIELRLFNPFVHRGARWLGYLTDFSRLNRRMHNKSFTADNQATIIGGRNVGDEYFGAGDGQVYVDMDVLAVGPVVQAVSADFDRYWASGSSYPIAKLVKGEGPLPPARGDREAYLQSVRQSRLVQSLLEGRLELEWARTRMVSDDPAKGLGLAPESALLPRQLGELLGEPRRHVELVSAYFVPAEEGTGMLADMARRARLRILTNSLEATDVAVVHAGYAKRRRELLAAGAILYELRRLSSGGAGAPQRAAGSGSSAASLHAKTFALDGERVFIGSFNFDPRSAHLNTEMGFVIESAALAGRIEAAFARDIPARAYEARLSSAGDLYWIERRGGGEIRHDTEPGAGFWKRAAVRILSLLPIDWLL